MLFNHVVRADFRGINIADGTAIQGFPHLARAHTVISWGQQGFPKKQGFIFTHKRMLSERIKSDQTIYQISGTE